MSKKELLYKQIERKKLGGKIIQFDVVVLTSDWLSSSESSLLDKTRDLRFIGDVWVGSFLWRVIVFDEFPLDVRTVWLLTSRLIFVGDEFLLLLVFVDKTDACKLGLVRLVIENVFFSIFQRMIKQMRDRMKIITVTHTMNKRTNGLFMCVGLYFLWEWDRQVVR